MEVVETAIALRLVGAVGASLAEATEPMLRKKTSNVAGCHILVEIGNMMTAPWV